MRIRAYLVVVFFALSSVTQPARAFLPPAIYAAYMTASVSGATYTMAGLAGAIGLTGMYLTIQDAQDNQVRIPLSENPDSQPAAPAAPVSSPTVTKSLWGGGCAVNSTPFIHDSRDGACAAAGGTSSYFEGVYLGCRDEYGMCSIGTSDVVACPAGYTMSSGSCVVSNPRQAINDNACDLLYAQGAFAVADDMNCGASADGSKVAPMIRDGKVIAYGTNSSGQPLMWEVTPGPQTWTVREYEQVQTSTQTQVKQTTAVIDAATSAVTSVQTQTSPGAISSPGASSVPSVTDPVTQPTTPDNTPTATTSPEGWVFPDDYARRGEAATAANTIKTAIETATTDPQTDNPEVVAPEVSELKDSFYGPNNPALGLLNFAVPAHSSICPTAQLNFDWKIMSWSGTFDGHCSIAETMRPTIAVIFDTVWLILAFYIVLGA